MDSILQSGLEVTRWLQQSYPQLRGFMEILSQLGTTEFYLAVLPLFYWSINKRTSLYLLALILITGTINGFSKQFFRGPRPYWLDATLGSGDDGRYGLPSGHVQMATMFYTYIAYWVKRGWATLLAIVAILLMATSRIYLGVHFIHDTVLGFLFSILIFVAFLVWRWRYEEAFRKRILGRRLLYGLMVPVGLTAVYLIGLLIIGQPNTNVEWASFIPAAEREGIDDVVTGVSALVGLVIGALLEGSRIRFRSDGPPWKRVVRYLLGIVIVFGLWVAMRIIFPSDPLWLGIILRFVRYCLTLLLVTYFVPLFFVRIGLADADPKPEMSLKL